MIFPLFLLAHFSTIYNLPLAEHQGKSEIVWEVNKADPFDELILSWNAPRTSDSQYTFFVSLHQNGEWSPFLFYGDWGKSGQMLPVERPADSFAETNRGITRPNLGSCDGFRVQIHNGGKGGLQSLSATLSNLAQFPAPAPTPSLPSVLIDRVPSQSVHTLRLDRHWDMTMVAASISAIRYLGQCDIDIPEFVSYTMDNDFESYDFFPLHAAEASHRLGGKYQVRIERLAGFADIHAYLTRGTPVLVNVQGTPIGGLPWPPYRSHVLCVIGYDGAEEKVICLDPVFPTNKSTTIRYRLDDFLKVWAKRFNIACVFTRKS